MRKLALLLMFFLGINMTHADSIAPSSSYSQISKDKKYILVMLVEEEPYGLWAKEHEKKLTGLRKKYKKSGLYEIATNKLIWSVDFYDSVTLSSDNKHLIGHGPWAGDSIGLTDIAFSIYKKGKFIKQYKVNELVKDKKQIQRTVSHYYWETRSHPNIKIGFSKDNKKYTLITCDKLVYEFDVNNGQIIKQYVDRR